MIKIKTIKARQILDSRGNPTVECDIYLEDNTPYHDLLSLHYVLMVITIIKDHLIS